VWYPYRRICYATMAREAAQASYRRLHKDLEWHDGTFTRWAKEPSAEFAYHIDAGVHIGVSRTDLAPWDKFTTERDASPLVADEQAPSDEAESADEADEGH